jgi:dienelactone hydrolase
VVYPGAYHGFDSMAPLRVRKDVPNGVQPGQGVTAGGDPAARDAARMEMLAFLREQLR